MTDDELREISLPAGFPAKKLAILFALASLVCFLIAGAISADHAHPLPPQQPPECGVSGAIRGECEYRVFSI